MNKSEVACSMASIRALLDSITINFIADGEVVGANKAYNEHNNTTFARKPAKENMKVGRLFEQVFCGRKKHDFFLVQSKFQMYKKTQNSLARVI